MDSSNPLANSLNTREHSIVEIVTTTVLSGGLIHLAAERLHITPDALMYRLSTDPLALELMSKQLRVKMLLDAAVNMEVITAEVMNGLKNANYSDTVKAMQAYSDLFLELTKTQQNNSNLNINVFDKVMAMLPQEVREAVQLVTTNAVDSNNVPLSFRKAQGRPRKQLASGDDE